MNRYRRVGRQGKLQASARVYHDAGSDTARTATAATQKVAVGPGRKARRDRCADRAAFPVYRDEPFVAPRESDRVGAVIPPVIQVSAGDDATKADHAREIRIAMLAYPLPDRCCLEAGRAADVVGVAAGVGGRAHLAPGL
jgi:hypothetical protein